ncbi:MAG: hypothetical protein Q9165_003996 [Trypethelium subeluteriae]
MVRSDSRVHFFIDNLDECFSQPEEIIQRLRSIARPEKDQLKLVIADAYREIFDRNGDSYRRISMDDKHIVSVGAEQFIVTKVYELAQKDPIWVVLDSSDLARFYISLENTTYLLAKLRMLLVQKNFKRTEKGWLNTAMRWIAHAMRPLKSSELSLAVALEEAAEEYVQTPDDYISWDIVSDIQQAVGPLIEIVDDIIYPIHGTLKTFLVKRDKDSDTCSHYSILERCIKYLMSTEYDYSHAFSPQDRKLGLLSYACEHWPEHLRLTNTAAKAKAIALVDRFLGNDDAVKAWAGLYHHLTSSTHDVSMSLDTRPKIVCYFGMTELIDDSIGQGLETEQKGELLDLAIKKGHIHTVPKLLNNGAQSKWAAGVAAAGGCVDISEFLRKAGYKLDQRDPRGFTPLHCASFSGQEIILEYLLNLKCAVNFDLLASESETALHLAARAGHEGCVKSLVEKGADIHAEDQYGYDILKYAAIGGFTGMVMWLVDHGAKPKTLAKDEKSALQLAVERGHCSTVDFLLRNIPSDFVGYAIDDAIDIAAREGHLDILQLLFDEKRSSSGNQNVAPDKHITDLCEVAVDETLKLEPNHRKSPLEWAAERGHTRIVPILLQNDLGHDWRDCSAALLIAAQEGQEAIVSLLLDHGASVSALDSNGWTAMHVASKYGNGHILRKLLQHTMSKVLIDQPAGYDGTTPLHLAVGSGHVEIIDILLEHDANPNLKSNAGMTALHVAVKEGHLQAVKRLCLPEILWLRDNNNMTALDMAVAETHVEMAGELIQALVDVHEESARLKTLFPLHLAIKLEHEGTIRYLLDKGWDHNKPDDAGNAPLQLATQQNFLPGMEMLLKSHCDPTTKNHRKETPLHRAARLEYIGAAKILLEFKANIDTTDHYGRTPLFHAVWHKKIEVVKLLLGFNMMPNLAIGNSRSWTLLHAAVDSGTITELLIAANAEPNSINDNGLTPLALACKYGYTDTVKALLKGNADPNLTGDKGSTPLHLACTQPNNLEIIQLLVEKGAKLQAMDEDSLTALQVAASHADKDSILYLVERGADIHGRIKDSNDDNGNGPILTLCASRGGRLFPELAPCLLQHGADVNEVGGPYHTALQAACAQNGHEVVEWLLDRKVNPNVKGGEFGTALCAAVDSFEREQDSGEYGRIERDVRLLHEFSADINLSEGEKPTALQRVTKKGADKAVCLLLELGASVNIVRGKQDPPLSAAISAGCNLETVEALLRAKANLTAAGPGGLTPLQATIKNDRDDILKLLKRHGFDPSTKDEDGRSMLTYAIAWRSRVILSYVLKECNVDVHEQDAAGRTPLMSAVLAGDRGLTGTLRERGFAATIEARDSEGKTVLIQAVSLDRLSTVKELLEYGADPTAEDGRGRGPLYWAARTARFEVLETIIAAIAERADTNPDCFRRQREVAVHGAIASDNLQALERLAELEDADIDENQSDGWTALYTARRCGFSRIERFLSRTMSGIFIEPTPQTPLAWHARDRTPALKLESNERRITVLKQPQYLQSLDSRTQGYSVARADFPMKPIINDVVYYFEVQIIKAEKDALIGIGFCEDRAPMDTMLGWDEGSWGYHADDGRAFSNGQGAQSSREYGDPYNVSDIVGCGVNFKEKTAFFTKNGEVIGCAFENITGKLYPAVCFEIKGEGWQVEATFCNDPYEEPLFRFNGPFDGPDTFKPSAKSSSVDNSSDDESPNLDDDMYTSSD